MIGVSATVVKAYTPKDGRVRPEKYQSVNIGERIALLREAAGYSQRKLANDANLDPGTISRIERNALDPTYSTLEKIALALGIALPALFAEARPPTSVDASGAPAQTVSRLRELEAEVAQNTEEIQGLVSERKVALAAIQEQIAELDERLSAVERRRTKAG